MVKRVVPENYVQRDVVLEDLSKLKNVVSGVYIHCRCLDRHNTPSHASPLPVVAQTKPAR